MHMTTKNVWAALCAIGLVLSLFSSPAHAHPFVTPSPDTAMTPIVAKDCQQPHGRTRRRRQRPSSSMVSPGISSPLHRSLRNLFIFETFGGSEECLAVNAPWTGLRQVGQTVEPGSCAQGPAGGWTG